MRRIAPLLAAALLAGVLTIFIPLQAQAGATLPIAASAATLQIDVGLITPAGYYGGYQQKNDYDDEGDGYGGDNYDDYGDHSYKPDHHSYCSPRYEKKYVCEQNEKRCFKQRECIWYYGREYCRYVEKCVGGERYCKWVDYPVRDCGYY